MNQEKKLRIAMACDPITDYIAGVFISTLRLSERLHARGNYVLFLAAKSPYSRDIHDYKGMPIYRFRSILMPKSEKRFRLAFPTISEVRKILQKEKIDILHVLLPTPLAFISITAAKSIGIKVVIHSHAQPENVTANLPWFAGKKIVNVILGAYFSWLYKKADSLVYPSEFARSIFEKHNSKIPNVVISNGIDTSLFKKVDTDELFNKWNLSKTKKNILFVGRLHPEKNIEILIKSVPHILKKDKNIQVFIVGPGHQKEELKALASSLGVSSSITFFGKVTDHELIMAYNACDIFVLPSIAELEGMVVLEAMSCGKPIVISDSKESASRFFVNENGFLFKTHDEIDLSQKILSLLEDDSLRLKMGQKSLELSKKYDINESVSKLEDLYHSLF